MGIFSSRSSEAGIIDRSFRYLHRLTVGDRFLISCALLATFVSLVWLLIVVSTGTRIEVPTSGGTFEEGVVGTPRFINPVLAVTRPDRDLVSLMYAGLMRLGDDGALTPNVAESITESSDGLTYNVVLRSDVTFHDGTPLTARDVAFTVERIQEPLVASPLRPLFESVSVEVVSDTELNFLLERPFAFFRDNLTFGILPEHIWRDISIDEFPFSQLNSQPIGAGPYMLTRVERTETGIPEAYVLSPFPRYHLGAPRIATFIMRFFPNDEKLIAAYREGTVDAIVALDHERLAELPIDPERSHVVTMPLPRTFSLFLNQNKSSVLREEAVRTALSRAIDRPALIDAVLGGYGTPIEGPIPPGFGVAANVATDTPENRIAQARDILTNAGWSENPETNIFEKKIDGVLTPLSVSISTVNLPSFETAAEFLRSAFESIGASVTVKQFGQSDLNQSVIRPREYETLLFGTALGRSLDFFPFWHSSQRNDPGLNVALYANIKADSILTEVRSSTSTFDRSKAIETFAQTLMSEEPALFLYAPELTYVFPTAVIGAKFTGVAEPQERFLNVHEWYIKTESVWPVFQDEPSAPHEGEPAPLEEAVPTEETQTP